jgi:hypothetical protein
MVGSNAPARLKRIVTDLGVGSVFRHWRLQCFGALALAVTILSAAGAMTALAQNAPVPPGAKPITDPAALHAIYAGHTVIGTNHFPDQPPKKWSEFHCPNGKSRWVYESKLYDGKWWIKDGRACFAYQEWDNGNTACFDVYAGKEGGLNLVDQAYPELGVIIIATSLPGDPLKIQKLDGGSCEDATS